MISENEFEEEEEETEEEASPSVRRRRRRRQTQQQPRSRLITPQRRSSNASIGNSGSRRNSPFQNLNNSPVVLLQDASVLLGMLGALFSCLDRFVT